METNLIFSGAIGGGTLDRVQFMSSVVLPGNEYINYQFNLLMTAMWDRILCPEN